MSGPGHALFLSTSEVGTLLGVHPSTVKRWSDRGILEGSRTQGGHRRFHLRSILQAAREQGISTFLAPFHPWEANVWLALQASRMEGDYSGVISLGLSWLRQGDTDLLGRFFFEMARMGEVPLPLFLDKAVRGFMARVGEEWQEGRLQVGEEHMATEVIHEAFIRLRIDQQDASSETPQLEDHAGVAVVGSAEGDRHDLGAQAVRVILEREGWRVYYLGADVPVEEFARIQKAQLANLVCISFHAGSNPSDLRRVLETLARYYDERMPYALALGGAVEEMDALKVSDQPFEGFDLSASAQDFHGWLQTQFPLSHNPAARRIA